MDNMEITRNKMTIEEVIDMLNAKICCINDKISGTNEMCNNGCCVDCSLCYEQGTMSEQKEALEAAIQSLEKDTVPFDFELYQAGLMDMPNGMMEVLDNIRAEIEQERIGYPPSSGYYKAIMKCLQIIDKYKKSEDKHMYKKLADLTVSKSSDYYGKVVKALEEAGFLMVLEAETTTDRYYIVAEDENKEYEE